MRDVRDSGLPSGASHVAWAIAVRSRGGVWHGRAGQLVADTRLSESTVRRALSDLRRRGWLTVEVQPGDHRGATYTLAKPGSSPVTQTGEPCHTDTATPVTQTGLSQEPLSHRQGTPVTQTVEGCHPDRGAYKGTRAIPQITPKSPHSGSNARAREVGTWKLGDRRPDSSYDDRAHVIARAIGRLPKLAQAFGSADLRDVGEDMLAVVLGDDGEPDADGRTSGLTRRNLREAVAEAASDLPTPTNERAARQAIRIQLQRMCSRLRKAASTTSAPRHRSGDDDWHDAPGVNRQAQPETFPWRTAEAQAAYAADKGAA